MPEPQHEPENAENAVPELAPADAEAQQKALDEEKAKAEKYLANWLRSQADYINLRRRSEQEKEELRQFANSTLMVELLPALDDLDIAFASIPTGTADQGWVDGIKLAYRKLQSILEKQGLAPIKALGEPFDPRFHEAVSQAKGKDGIVVTEVQKGYSFRDKVIRPAKVIVGNGDE